MKNEKSKKVTPINSKVSHEFITPHKKAIETFERNSFKTPVFAKSENMRIILRKAVKAS